MTDLHFLTIARASALIKAQKLSPVELTTAFLARVQRLDTSSTAICWCWKSRQWTRRRAEAEIAASGWKGPLHGIPIGLKDIYNTAGIRTTGHSALFADHVPTEDAFTVSLLREAGAVITGKLATWEFAIGGILVRPAMAAGAQSVGCRSGSLGVVVRIGCGGGRGLVHGCDGQRHRRIDSRAGRMVRHRRA